MHKIIYTKRVQLNLIEIKNFISKDNPYYAIKVINNIESTIDILKNYPFIWKEVSDIHRLITEPKYKFKIVYRINWDIIYILSIFKYQNNWE